MAQWVDFRDAETAGDLSEFLGIDAALFREVISGSAEKPHYIAHRIPKSRPTLENRYRLVWDVTSKPLRDAHRAFARRIEAFIRAVEPAFPHDAAFGYLTDRDTRRNAERHCGARYLLNADIEEFFPSITTERLTQHLARLGLRSEVAEALARFATIEGVLAVGLNASPTLSNLVCLNLDRKLAQLADRQGARYTRYSDDISISADANLPSYVQVSEVVASEGFRLAAHKHRITTRGQAHFVTGLSISDAVRPHVPRRMKRSLRQELYYCGKFGLHEHFRRIEEPSYRRGVNRLDGTVRYVSGIELASRTTLRTQWQAILSKEGTSISYAPVSSRTPRPVAFLFDETELTHEGRRYLALACIATENLPMIESTIKDLQRLYLKSPFSPGRKEIVRAKGFHFAEDHEGLRAAYIELLAYLPYRAYVAFGAMGDKASYEGLYCSLLAHLLPRRFQAHDSAEVRIIAERNPRVSQSAVEQVVAACYAALEKHDDRRPRTLPTVGVGTKQANAGLSVADYLLGVLNRYTSLDGRIRQSAQLHFERLRDKYRHIIDVDSARDYSRRHPFAADAIP